MGEKIALHSAFVRGAVLWCGFAVLCAILWYGFVVRFCGVILWGDFAVWFCGAWQN